jgi:hypothetical protein
VTAVVLGLVAHSIGLVAAGLAALVTGMVLPRPEDVHWSSGDRCTACGHVEMLRG